MVAEVSCPPWWAQPLYGLGSCFFVVVVGLFFCFLGFFLVNKVFHRACWKSDYLPERI